MCKKELHGKLFALVVSNPEFKRQPKHFWAYVRTLSQCLGYTVRGKGIVKVPTFNEMQSGLSSLGLDFRRVVSPGNPTQLGEALDRYFRYRSKVLNDSVQRQLMMAEEARQILAIIYLTQTHGVTTIP